MPHCIQCGADITSGSYCRWCGPADSADETTASAKAPEDQPSAKRCSTTEADFDQQRLNLVRQADVRLLKYQRFLAEPEYNVSDEEFSAAMHAQNFVQGVRDMLVELAADPAEMRRGLHLLKGVIQEVLSQRNDRPPALLTDAIDFHHAVDQWCQSAQPPPAAMEAELVDETDPNLDEAHPSDNLARDRAMANQMLQTRAVLAGPGTTDEKAAALAQPGRPVTRRSVFSDRCAEAIGCICAGLLWLAIAAGVCFWWWS